MFYEKIEKEIQKRQMNLNQLAKGAGITQSGTSRWKSGTMPSCEVLVRICRYLNVSADYLLDLDDTPPPPVLSDRETLLLEHFRLCKPETQGNIELLASSGAEEALKQETSSELKNIG
ncbi:MAG: helix-turn-helix domain-containing protein [Lachnospiraceae bacterium]